MFTQSRVPMTYMIDMENEYLVELNVWYHPDIEAVMNPPDNASPGEPSYVEFDCGYVLDLKEKVIKQQPENSFFEYLYNLFKAQIYAYCKRVEADYD